MNFANFANFAKLGAKSFAFREILKTQKISNTKPHKPFWQNICWKASNESLIMFQETYI